MKNLLMAVVLVAGMTSFAQEKSKEIRKERTEQMSPEQRAELKVKELTLQLDLNTKQQQELTKIFIEQGAKRKEAMAERKADKEKSASLTADQKFAKKSKMLDDRIAMKERIKAILTPQQMTKWEQLNAEKKGKMRHGMKKKHSKVIAPQK